MAAEPFDPGRVVTADVYKGDALAGRLSRLPGGAVEFRYLTRHLEEGGPAVGFRLPLRAEPYVAHGGSVPPFFANLLPEGARFTALRERFRTSADDMLTLLIAVGVDCVGDVRVFPAGEPAYDPEPIERPADWSEVSFDRLLARSVSSAPADHEPVALPGAQEKVSDVMISFPVRAGAGAFILKLNPPRFPRIVENEDFFLRMARACGIETATGTVVHDAEGRSGLLVERFDRVREAAGRVRRLALEDGCQLCDVYPAEKYQLRTLELGRAVLELATPGIVAVAQLIELVAFSFLVVNEDLHAKNVSLLEEADGLVRFSPGYDILSTLPYAIDHHMALEFEGRQNELRRQDFLAFADRLGVGPRAVERRLDRICDEAPAWIDRLDEIGFDEATTQRMGHEMRARRERLGGASSSGQEPGLTVN